MAYSNSHCQRACRELEIVVQGMENYFLSWFCKQTKQCLIVLNTSRCDFLKKKAGLQVTDFAARPF